MHETICLRKLVEHTFCIHFKIFFQSQLAHDLVSVYMLGCCSATVVAIGVASPWPTRNTAPKTCPRRQLQHQVSLMHRIVCMHMPWISFVGRIGDARTLTLSRR